MIDKFSHGFINSVYHFNDYTLNELICKLAQKMDEVITQANESFNYLEWLKGQGLSDEVIKIMLEWKEDGTLESLINDVLLQDINTKVDTFKTEVDTFKTEVSEQMENIAYNSKNFNAIGDCGGWSNFNVITGTDDTLALQTMILKAELTNQKLMLEPGKNYRITDTLTISNKIIFDGNNSTITCDIVDKTKSAIVIKNCRSGRIKNLNIQGNCLVKSGIEFQLPDNQKLILDNVKVKWCRHGLYTEQGECINRLILEKCEITNNIISGVWFVSYENDDNYSISAPIKLQDTIVNDNGIFEFMKNKQQNGVAVITDEKLTYQIYMKGIGGSVINGGQISADQNSLLSHHLIYAEKCDSFSIQGTDIEKCKLCGDDGIELINYDQYLGTKIGGIIHFEKCKNIVIDNIGGFELNGVSVVKLSECSGYVDINSLSFGDKCARKIDVYSSNTYYDDSIGYATLKLSTNLPLSTLSQNALQSLDNSHFETIYNVQDDIRPINGLNVHFDNSYGISDDGYYKIGQIVDENNPSFGSGCWVQKEVNNPSVFFAVLDCYQNTTTTSGCFFVEFLNKDKTRINYYITDTKGNDKVFKNKMLKPFLKLIPDGTVFVKFGFIMNKTYDGTIGNNKNVTVKGLKVMIGYDKPMLQHTSVENDLNQYRNLLYLNKGMGFGTSAPTDDKYYNRGYIIFNTQPLGGRYIGWVCTTAGSPGVWLPFGLISNS